jgi:phytoene dehydrogenase-like protein
MIGAINEAGLDPTRVPKGKALIKFIVHFVPYRVTGDASGRIRRTHWDDIKHAYADALIDMLAEHFLPGLRNRIIARSIQSPLDYERRIISAVHGTHQHGAFLPYQIGGHAADPGIRLLPLVLPISISAVPEAIRGQASPWRQGATPRR